MSKQVRISNLSTGEDLVTSGRVADTFWQRGKGLIGCRELAPGSGLLIDPCTSVHCFFMSIPIDVVYLDRSDKIVGIDEELRPWRVGGFYRGATRVIELPAGTVAGTATRVGHGLQVVLGD